MTSLKEEMTTSMKDVAVRDPFINEVHLDVLELVVLVDELAIRDTSRPHRVSQLPTMCGAHPSIGIPAHHEATHDTQKAQS